MPEFSKLTYVVTTTITGFLSPKDTIALSETSRHFRDLTAGKRLADKKIVGDIADFNRKLKEDKVNKGGTSLELVERWLALGIMTNWVGALDEAGAIKISQAITRNNHPKLTSLDIHIHFGQTTQKFNRVLDILLGSNKGTNLKTLIIGTDDYWDEDGKGIIGCSTSDDDIGLVAHYCPNLTSITVEGSYLHNNFIIHLAKKCIYLEHVDLEGPSCIFTMDKMRSDIDDVGIIGLAENCINLKHLNIGGLSQPTDKSLFALGEKCPNLSWIRLYTVLNHGGMDPTIPIQYSQDGLEALKEGCMISYRKW